MYYLCTDTTASSKSGCGISTFEVKCVLTTMKPNKNDNGDVAIAYTASLMVRVSNTPSIHPYSAFLSRISAQVGQRNPSKLCLPVSRFTPVQPSSAATGHRSSVTVQNSPWVSTVSIKIVVRQTVTVQERGGLVSNADILPRRHFCSKVS